MTAHVKNTCKQCGQCCRNDGPLLHEIDIELVAEGHIALRELVTLRAQELVHDAVQTSLIPLAAEVVKIAGTQEKAHPWHCVLHSAKGCSLHPLRPAQCKALFCTDTSILKDMYNTNRASRILILDTMPHAFAGQGKALIEAHEEHCALESCKELLAQNTADAKQELSEKIRFDMSFRELCVQKNVAQEHELPFLLGRPLWKVLQGLS